MLLVDACYVKRNCQIQIQLGTLEHVKNKTNNVTKHENHTTQFNTKSYSVQNDKPKSAHNKAHQGIFLCNLVKLY